MVETSQETSNVVVEVPPTGAQLEELNLVVRSSDVLAMSIVETSNGFVLCVNNTPFAVCDSIAQLKVLIDGVIDKAVSKPL